MAEIVNRVRFDPTVNLGHVLTFIGFIISGFLAYQNIDKRIVVLEESKKTQELRDQYQDAQNILQNKHIHDNLIEIKKAIDRLDNKWDKAND